MYTPLPLYPYTSLLSTLYSLPLYSLLSTLYPYTPIPLYLSTLYSLLSTPLLSTLKGIVNSEVDLVTASSDGQLCHWDLSRCVCTCVCILFTLLYCTVLYYTVLLIPTSRPSLSSDVPFPSSLTLSLPPV